MGPIRFSHTAALVLFAAGVAAQPPASPLEEQNRALFEELRAAHGLSDEQTLGVERIFARSPVIGQGNPAITRHPATPGECREKTAGVEWRSERWEKICGGPFMAPLYDPASQAPEEATACIDLFEFPDVPCAYPVVWVRASEAAELCATVGKRLCDAHEWEGACEGSLSAPDYRFDLAVGVPEASAVSRMREAHNRAHSGARRWSYGAQYEAGVCAAASFKSPQCEGGQWSDCGSNTYPAGMFPGCRSPLGVYDLNGNAAEHMNLPLSGDEMASSAGAPLGVTEMKGSWFIFDRYRAHEDWCRWRAPYWHGSRVQDPKSHHNYHLGFRCCRTVAPGAGR